MKILSKRRQKQLIGAVIALIIIGVSSAVSQQREQLQLIPDTIQDSGSYTVSSFADGDTISVEINGKKETVRFIGVDTPEVKDPRKPVQCFGEAASQFTKALIGTNPVRLESDPQNNDRDRYNRLLRYVYLPDGTLVNAEIIKQGYGFAYLTYPFTKEQEFKSYENAAREQSKGLWSNCEN